MMFCCYCSISYFTSNVKCLHNLFIGYFYHGYAVDLESAPLSLVSTIWELQSRKSRLRPWGIRRVDYAPPPYAQKLALTLPTSGGRSVGTVRRCRRSIVSVICNNGLYSTAVSGMSVQLTDCRGRADLTVCYRAEGWGLCPLTSLLPQTVSSPYVLLLSKSSRASARKL
jgi:hypothetical protein